MNAAKLADAPGQAGYRSMLVSQAAPARPEEKERYKVGDKIDGRFEILAVHLGGMGVVYGTFDHSQRMPRALKTLQLRFAERPGMRKLFTEEASVWVQLEKHPFIVRALIVQQYDGHPFVITEYIVGQQGMGCDLRSWLGHPRLTHAVAVEMALEIAQGMQHATRKVPGLLHRDLKPANVLVDDRGRALVTDFGLSRAAAAGAGTPAYMAPEQWHNGTLDQRTDIYAYGCVLYEMFSRHRLFACRSLEDWQAAHLERMPVAISQLARVPAEIEQFIFRCLAKDPNGRPANWDEVVEACAGWFYNLTGQPAVRDFSAYTLNEDELVGASHSLGQLRKYPEMLEVCNRLLAANPKSREGMINKIAALNELSRWDEALALIDQVLAMNARDAYAWSSRCVVLGHLGRNEESLAAIVESLAIDPNSSLAWRTKALALGRLGRTAEQLEAIEQALAVNRRDAAAWNTKAYVLQNTGRWKEAVEACDEALAINPIDTYALQARAVALEKVGRLDDAVADYERALAIDPEGVDEWLQRSAGRAWSSKGNALFQSGQFQQALAAFDRSLAINPRWAPSWIGRAAALERFARWPEKLAAAERAIELDPQSALAFQHKGIALGELNRLEDALEAYERACAISPNEANIKKRDALRERLLTHVAEEPVDPAALSYRAPAGQKPKQHPEAGYRSILVAKAAPVTAEEIERYKVGEKIGGRFEVLAIHRGGMGVVYGAFDHHERLPRALKTLQLRFAVNAGMRDLFASEAALWVRLEKHPYIVRAFLVNHYDGQPFVITEYVRGPAGMGSDLRSWLGHPRLTLPVAMEMALQIAQGMQHATRKVSGLLHRDLKPANVLVDDKGRALVTDFGLANAAASGAGTPAYMSPEQWRSGKLDPRTDIYGYGCILYEMFTGHRLFVAASLDEWKAAHLTRMPYPIARLADVPPELADFVFRCLAKDPNARPANWDEVVSTCADWFHRLTGQPAVLDFSAYSLQADELVAASHSMGQLRRYTEMLEICERMLARNPAHREALINKIAALDKLGRLDEALATINQVLAANPRDAMALDSKSVVLGRLRRNEESLAAIEQALAIDPGSSHAWGAKGHALDRLERFAESVVAYEKSLSIKRGDMDIWISLLQALGRLKRYDDVVVNADRAAAVNPVDERPWLEKDRAYQELGRYAEALAAADRALALNPKSFYAYYDKAYMFVRTGRWAEALESADRAIALQPSETYSWGLRRQALMNLERWEEALAAAERMLIIEPRHVAAWTGKGDALDKLGRAEDAVAAYDQALALNPRHSAAATARERLVKRIAGGGGILGLFKRK